MDPLRGSSVPKLGRYIICMNSRRVTVLFLKVTATLIDIPVEDPDHAQGTQVVGGKGHKMTFLEFLTGMLGVRPLCVVLTALSSVVKATR